jgi:uncharacterized membrane protein YphA (DoxX/SURF4 family)
MNIVLWILQVLLAAEFVFHGWIFLFPPADLVDIINANYAPWFRTFLGVAEWLGAAGLILPGITRIMPWLIPLASLGLTIVAGSASVYHLYRGETESAMMTVVLFVLCAFVAYMRWKVKPIPGRQIA